MRGPSLHLPSSQPRFYPFRPKTSTRALLLVHSFSSWFSVFCRLVGQCRANCSAHGIGHLFVFFLQLVLLPLSVLLFGPSQGVLPFLPSDRAINLAMLINTAAFVAFCATYHYFARHSEIGRQASALQQDSRVVGRAPSLAYIALNGVMGFAGFFFAFGALSKVAEYFSDPSGYLSRLVDVSDKLGPAAGQFLRPFLGICVVMLWCRWLDRKRSHKTKGFSSIVTTLAILAVCFSNATFNYNRGSLVVPLVAMLAVIVSGPSRVPRRTVVSAGAIVLVVLFLTAFLWRLSEQQLHGSRAVQRPLGSRFPGRQSRAYRNVSGLWRSAHNILGFSWKRADGARTLNGERSWFHPP